MPQINALPNFYNGKVYKHWLSIKPLVGQNGFIASKMDKNRNYIQLLITDNGKRRKLLSSDKKIMDTIDLQGIKRTYVYERDKTGDVRGQMFLAKDDKVQPPLITAAKWISHNCVPQRLFIKLNPAHKSSKIFIPAEQVKNKNGLNNSGSGKTIHAKEIFANNFEFVYDPIPKTIVIKTTKGKEEIITSDHAGKNINLIKQLDIKSDVLGWKLRTMV